MLEMDEHLKQMLNCFFNNLLDKSLLVEFELELLGRSFK